MKTPTLIGCLFALCAATGFAAQVSAQDLEGGEIQVTCLGPLQYSATINIYVKGSLDQNRSSYLLHWGDGQQTALPVATQANLPNDTRRYTATGMHVYSGAAIYTLHCTCTYRLAGIVNIDSSATQELYLQSVIYCFPTFGCNSLPQLSSSHTDFTYAAGQLHYNPGAIDAEGDSLSYQLYPCSNGYTFPNASLDSLTGDFTMPVSGQDSLYAVAIQVAQWQHFTSNPAMMTGYVVSDILINVPELVSVEEAQTGIDFSVSPNPCAERTTLRGNTVPGEVTTVTVFDLLGQEQKSQQYTGLPASLSLADLPDGVYLLNIRTAGTAFTRRIVVQH